MLSASLLLSFVSYFFYWTIDLDKVNEPLNFVRDNSVRANNWMGKFGAIVANQFIRNWFGIGSFMVVLPLFVLGFRLMFQTNILPFFKTLRHSVLILIWLSLSAAFFIGSPLNLGGAFGYHVNIWTDNLMGRTGTGFLVLFVGLA